MSPRRRWGLAAAVALAAALAAPPARAAGAWRTYIRMLSCNDMVAQGDTLWLGSGEAGLVRYLPATGSFDYTYRDASGLISNTISVMALDARRRLWVGTPGLGVSRLSADRRTWSLLNAFDGLPSDTITALRADGDSMWIGTAGGFGLWDGDALRGSIPDIGVPSPFLSNAVSSIVVYGDSLFVGTAAGVYVARKSQKLAGWTTSNTGLIAGATNVIGMACSGRDLFCLARTADNRLAAAHKWDPATGSWVWGGVTTSKPPLTLRDSNGRVLCATRDGVYEWVVEPTGAHFALIGGTPGVEPGSTALNGGVAYAVDYLNHIFAFGRLPLTTGDRRLYDEFPTRLTAHTPPGPPANGVVNMIRVDSDIWVSTDGAGIARLRGDNWRVWSAGCFSLCDTAFTNPLYPYALLPDTLSTLWVGCWSGSLARINTLADPLSVQNLLVSDTYDQLRHSFIWCAAADSTRPAGLRGRWMGMDSNDLGTPGKEPIGIDLYDASGLYLRSFQPGYPGLNDGQIRGLACDRNNLMWVGYAVGGIDVFRVPAPESLSLPAPVKLVDVPGTGTLKIFGIVPHGDSVWVLTDHNLQRFRAGDQSYQTTLEIPDAPFKHAAVHPLDVAPDGTVWVATGSGVRMFPPGAPSVDFTASNSQLAGNEVRSVYVEPSTGAVWFATTSGLNRYDPYYRPPPPPRVSSLALRVFPNPANMTAFGFELHLSGASDGYSGVVLDLAGRVVGRFSGAANGHVVWDGRDLSGRAVPPGVYFVRARAGGATGTARVVVLH